MFDLIQLLHSKVDPAKIKKASGSKGGEWHSPCPLCGGEDRFSVFPNQPGGELCQKHGLNGTWACMRGCRKGGDLVSWFMEIEGMSFKAACAELKIELENHNNLKRGYRPLQPPVSVAASEFVPAVYDLPSEQWRQAATKLAQDAYHHIYDYPFILKYLAYRGLPQSAIDEYGLGYIEGDNNHPEAIYRSRSAYGLPDKTGKDGKPIRAFRIPRGITIPVWSKNNQVLRIRIRRRDIDRDKSDPKDPKYLLVPQSGKPYSAPLMLYPKDIPLDLATWVITESELDAMAVHHACEGQVGAISILTAKGKPDKTAHDALSVSPRILVALDADEEKADGSNPGIEGWLWWKQTYPQAKFCPVPEGKDPGEAFALGVNLADWIFAGTPLRKKQLIAGSFVSISESENNGKLGKSQNNIVVEDARGKDAYSVPSSVRSFLELQLPERVSHAILLESQMEHPLDDPDCLIPCPKTSPPFWWTYHRDCKRFKCAGHPLCMIEVLGSQIFLEALNAEKNLSR